MTIQAYQQRTFFSLYHHTKRTLWKKEDDPREERKNNNDHMTPYKQMLIMTCCNNNKCILLTKLTTSLAAMAMISAQETLFLQRGTLSTASFAFITVSNPSPARDRLSELSFSDVKFLENSMTEASHPCPSEEKKNQALLFSKKKCDIFEC